MSQSEINQAIADNAMTPIGEVRVLIYNLQPGGCEVELKLPASAQSGAPGAGAQQAQILKLVNSEVTIAMQTVA
ncbi:MAG: hypothetical protein ACRDMX_16945 [Solirubrobacteraceae bacterium]